MMVLFAGRELVDTVLGQHLETNTTLNFLLLEMIELNEIDKSILLRTLHTTMKNCKSLGGIKVKVFKKLFKHFIFPLNINRIFQEKLF